MSVLVAQFSILVSIATKRASVRTLPRSLTYASSWGLGRHPCRSLAVSEPIPKSPLEVSCVGRVELEHDSPESTLIALDPGLDGYVFGKQRRTNQEDRLGKLVVGRNCSAILFAASSLASAKKTAYVLSSPALCCKRPISSLFLSPPLYL